LIQSAFAGDFFLRKGELYAITEAIAKFRHYLLSQKFIIRTDQKSLKSLTEQTIQTPEQQKWLRKFFGFDFSIELERTMLLQMRYLDLSMLCLDLPRLPSRLLMLPLMRIHIGWESSKLVC
jgi:hypothetical protein